MIVRQCVYARAGLLGNPSDGYHGKTIAFTFRNHWAEVVLYESPELEFRLNEQDGTLFGSVDELLTSVRRTGYYGGIRLMKAAVKEFAEYCRSKGIELPGKNFTIRYETNIPRQLGLGGSSAIITAAMKALMGFYGVDIQPHVLPNVVLAAETEELNLTAGLQDRVVQAHNGLIYMDFDEPFMKQNGYGRYERLDARALPLLYVAYKKELSEESSRAHLRVRELYELGDTNVITTMQEIASLADEARDLLNARRGNELHDLINRNFDLRASIYHISDENMALVESARGAGASCKFCGSGGAVVGSYRDEDMLADLRDAMSKGGYELVVPDIVTPDGHQ